MQKLKAEKACSCEVESHVAPVVLTIFVAATLRLWEVESLQKSPKFSDFACKTENSLFKNLWEGF